MDEEEPKQRLQEWPPKSLEHMSLDALEAYAKALQTELGRVKQTVESRSKQRAAADSIFKR
ncbi:MAG: DUF1192 domain-containing protein [Alphaproteobacteria bacterium]|nr:DUF1192 domain-containing protein [Alphaproteobacteria bacterium]